MMEEKKFANAYVFFFTLSLLFIILRTAWISDDAGITLRTILNFTNGFGPTFNIQERVQAYTHPLWFLILSLCSVFFSNIFHATFFVSIYMSFKAITTLLWKFRRNFNCLIIISIVLALSKAFIDFSTSGLENPLSHALIVYFVLFAFPLVLRDPTRLTQFYLLCSAFYLNRPDLPLLILPAALFVTYRHRNKLNTLAKSIMIGLTPVVIWTSFSLIYYGFPFPNSSYAKLANGLSLSQQVIQGFTYLFHSIDRDPLTILVMFIGMVVGFTRRAQFKALSLGIILYNIYIISIGGDFMEGRFYTSPFLMALIILAYSLQEISLRQTALISAFPIVFLGAINFYPNILSGSVYSSQHIPPDGIADERAFYFEISNLLRSKLEGLYYPEWEENEIDVLSLCGGIGFSGIKEGPSLHFIDECALTDPFLARLRPRTDIKWRIGHFYRKIPENYEESILQNENLLENECQKDLYASIRKITRGKIFSWSRFLEIIKVNLSTMRGTKSC